MRLKKTLRISLVTVRIVVLTIKILGQIVRQWRKFYNIFMRTINSKRKNSVGVMSS